MVPFDLNATSLEIKGIEAEIKRIQKILRDLKTKKDVLLEKMQKYFKENEHQGVIINGMKIETITKEKTKQLTKKEKEEQIKQVLSHYVDAPHILAEQLQQVTKGQKIEQQKIVISQKGL